MFQCALSCVVHVYKYSQRHKRRTKTIFEKCMYRWLMNNEVDNTELRESIQNYICCLLFLKVSRVSPEARLGREEAEQMCARL